MRRRLAVALLALVCLAGCGGGSAESLAGRLAGRAHLSNCGRLFGVAHTAYFAGCDYDGGVVRLATFNDAGQRDAWLQAEPNTLHAIGDRWAMIAEPAAAHRIARVLGGQLQPGGSPPPPGMEGAASTEGTSGMSWFGWLVLLVPLAAFLGALGYLMSRRGHSRRVARLGG